MKRKLSLTIIILLIILLSSFGIYAESFDEPNVHTEKAIVLEASEIKEEETDIAFVHGI